MKLNIVSVLALAGVSAALELYVYESGDCSGQDVRHTQIAHGGTCADNYGVHSFRYRYQGDSTTTVDTYVYPQSCNKHTGSTGHYVAHNQCTQCSPGWSECFNVNTGSAWVATYAVPAN